MDYQTSAAFRLAFFPIEFTAEPLPSVIRVLSIVEAEQYDRGGHDGSDGQIFKHVNLKVVILSVPHDPGRKIAHKGAACLLIALLACAGCDTRNENTSAAASTPPVTNAGSSEGTSEAANDVAKYEFHRNVAFTNVTKNLPDGSVDYIDLADLSELAGKSNVIVVATVTAPQKEGIRFTTTFIGANELRIKKQWSAASSNDHDGNYVGIFVLPPEVKSALTILESRTEVPQANP